MTPDLIAAYIGAAACGALLIAIAAAIVRDGGQPADPDRDHPGFGDIPPDDPGRPLDGPDYALAASMSTAAPTTYLHVEQPVDEPTGDDEGEGRHRAPELPHRIPPWLATYATWVAAGCPLPAHWTTAEVTA